MSVRDPIVVVGSGATAVHFAQTALEMGRAVHMLDVGYGKPEPERPTASLNELKEELDDPVRYFLGEDYQAVILPRNSEEYYGFPPSKSYVFRPVNGFDVKARGFAPLISFAQGGLAQAWTGGSYPFTDGELDRTFKVNVYAYVKLVRAALRHMKRGSAIVATSSVTGLLGSPELPDYSSTKGAINAFTRTMGQKLAERGIRINAVAPGPVWTPLNPADKGRTPKQIAKFGADVPMKRPAQPEELAPAYVFLASNADSSYITGSVLQVMGGETAGA